MKLGGPLSRGERTGPGFEGVSCPSCGALHRVPAGSDGLALECGCGSVFPCAGLRTAADRPPPDKPESSPVQTLFVHRGGQAPPSGTEPPPEPPQSPGDAPTLARPRPRPATGTSGQVIVTDFGLAKDMSEGSVLTVSGTALGTPVYMSPEQADGDLKKMGPRSDVYSMGAVLYEMITGREPFRGSSIGQVMASVLFEEPVPPRKARPGLHRDIETIIQEAINLAGPGSVIEVAEGRYEENLVITKPGLAIKAAAGARPEVGQGESGLRISADGLWGLRIQGFRFKVAEGLAVSISHAPGAVFADNSISAGTGGGATLGGSFLAIWGNEVTDCKEVGIGVYNSDYSVVAANTVKRAGWTGMLIDGGKGVAFARNISDSNARLGFWFGGGEKSSYRIFENVARGNPHWGFLFDKVGTIHVYDNFVTNTFEQGKSLSVGISVQDAKGGSVHHNTIHNNTMGVDLVFATLPFLDNIISGNKIGMHWHGSETVDYNCFWGNKVMMQWMDKNANSISELRSVYNWSTCVHRDRMAHGLEVDPKYADPDKGDFSLAEGSPCIGTASDGGNMGADWRKIKAVIEGRFDFTAWIREYDTMLCVSAADAEEKSGDSDAASAFLRMALAFKPGDPGLTKRIAELKKKQGS